MLEQLIEYMRAAIAATIPSAKVSGLAERIERDGRIFPATYCTKDEYKQPMQNEAYAYFRQLRPMTEAQSDEESVSGCDEFIVRTYPLTLVAYLPKNILESDDKYIDSKLVNNLSNVLTRLNWGAVISAAKVDFIRAQVRTAETDRYTVWRREYSGVDMAARFDHALIAIDFDVQVQASESCLRNFACGGEVINPKLCEDVEYTLKNTQGDVLSEGSVSAGKMLNLIAPDSVIENSTETFSQSIPSGENFTLPNPDISVNGSVEGQIVSQEPISVNLSDGTNPITPDAVNLVGNTLGITILPPFFSFEPEYRKVLLVGQGMGMTLPSSGVQVLQNQLVIDLKSAGAWAKDDILYVMAQDGSAEFACLNWKNPINHYLRRINAITFVPNQGLAGDGVSAYLDTRFDPSVDGVNYTLNDASRYFYLYDSTMKPNNFMDGIATANNRMATVTPPSTSQTNQINGGTSSPYTYDYNKEMKSIHRPDSANIAKVQAKVVTMDANASTSIQSQRQWILRASSAYGQHTVSFYSMGANQLAENNDKVDAFDNYINAL